MSNLINNDLPPPPDTAALAAAAADAAKTDPNGDAAFLARKNLEDAQFRAQQFQERQAFIDKQNAPVYAEMREQQDKQTTAIMTGAVAAVGTLAMAEMAVSHTGGLAAAFGGMSARKAETEPTTSEMGPAAAFSGRATKIATLAAILGREGPAETLSFGAPFMATGLAAAALSQTAEPAAPTADATPGATPTIQPQRPRNTSFMLENNSLAMGPKPPKMVSGSYGGGAEG